MRDLINRQKLCEYALNQKNKSITPNDIMRFPSAHPGLDEWCTDCKEYNKEKHCCPRWNRVIRETLKDAQLERPTGYWIEREDSYGDPYYECSKCKESFVLIDGTPRDNLYNYCPNCGARME